MEQEYILSELPCHCPTGKNKFGLIEKFHTSADEITNAILEAIPINPEKAREI